MSLGCALLAGFGIGAAIYRFPEIGWKILVVCFPATLALFATGYGIAKYGRVTHLAGWFWWLNFAVAFADTIARTLRHKIDDPFSDLAFDASYLFFCTLFVWGTRRRSRPGAV